MSPELITLRAYDTVALADVDRAILEAAGIPAFLANAETVGAAWLLSNAVGYVQLQVPAAFATQAEKILSTGHSDSEQTRTIFDHTTPTRDTQCLACGAKMLESDDVCVHCGWTFQESDTEIVDGEMTSPAQPPVVLAFMTFVVLVVLVMLLLYALGAPRISNE